MLRQILEGMDSASERTELRTAVEWDRIKEEQRVAAWLEENRIEREQFVQELIRLDADIEYVDWESDHE